jgi:hypothetical protein
MDSRGGSIAEELPKNGTDCPFCLPSEFDESQQQPSPAAAAKKNTAPTLNKYDQYAMQPKAQKFHLSNTVDGVHVRSLQWRVITTQSRTSYDVGRRGERSHHLTRASGADQLYLAPKEAGIHCGILDDHVERLS